MASKEELDSFIRDDKGRFEALLQSSDAGSLISLCLVLEKHSDIWRKQIRSAEASQTALADGSVKAREELTTAIAALSLREAADGEQVQEVINELRSSIQVLNDMDIESEKEGWEFMMQIVAMLQMLSMREHLCRDALEQRGFLPSFESIRNL